MTPRHPPASPGEPPLIEHLPVKAAWLGLYQEPVLEPTRHIIDPHHHLWEMNGGYLLPDLLVDLNSGHRIVATVFVQCVYAYRSGGPHEMRPVGETEFVASVATQARERGAPQQVCAGIVGHANLRLGDAVAPVLQAHIEAGQGRFRGVRQINAWHADFNANLLGRPPADLFQQAGFRQGLKQLQAAGLSFDAWLYHTQIDQLTELAQAFPDLPMVLNHVGGPLAVGTYIGQGARAHREWRASMQRLAHCNNVCVKLGGLAMVTGGFDFHQRAVPPSSEDLARAWAPYLQDSIELFGAARCMFESNFPVDKAMCSYAVLWNAFKRIASGASALEKACLFHNTANQFYRLGLPSA
jgi:L-fuconolactonase